MVIVAPILWLADLKAPSSQLKARVQDVSYMNGSPIERYHRDLKVDGFQYDSAQEAAVAQLQDLYDRLLASQSGAAPKSGFLSKWFGRDTGAVEPVRGLYFWGGVGRGKTYLMDNFYESLPFDNKMRVHFHRFMRRVHRELKSLSGEKNPLNVVADRLASEARVICFDEFFVSDITDAMILGTLMEAFVLSRS